MFSELAYAQTQDGGTPPSQSPPLAPNPLIFLLLFFVIIYFFMIRPQYKRQKTLQAFLKSLKPNDFVVTNSGIHGRVVNVREDDPIVTIEIADKVRVKFSKSQIAGISELATKGEKETKE